MPKTTKTQIPQFNNLQQLNNWIHTEFLFDSDNPLQQLLEDYAHAKEYICKVHNLVTSWESGEPPEKPEESKESERSELPLKVGVINHADEILKFRNRDGQEKELQIKLVKWDQEPLLSVNLETSYPGDMILFVPTHIYAHEYSLLLKKVIDKLAAEYGLTVINKAS